MHYSKILAEIVAKKSFSNKIRLYLIDKDTHYFLNDGILKKGFDSKLSLSNNRDSLLSVFSKMAFIFDEIIRLRIVGFSNDRKNKELIYLLNLIPINRKIRTFLDWNVFGPEFTRDMSRLFEVRNGVVHCMSLDEVQYSPKHVVSLSSRSGVNKFVKDFEKSWKTLLKIYSKDQEKIDWKKLLMSINSVL